MFSVSVFAETRTDGRVWILIKGARFIPRQYRSSEAVNEGQDPSSFWDSYLLFVSQSLHHIHAGGAGRRQESCRCCSQKQYGGRSDRRQRSRKLDFFNVAANDSIEHKTTSGAGCDAERCN